MDKGRGYRDIRKNYNRKSRYLKGREYELRKDGRFEREYHDEYFHGFAPRSHKYGRSHIGNFYATRRGGYLSRHNRSITDKRNKEPMPSKEEMDKMILEYMNRK